MRTNIARVTVLGLASGLAIFAAAPGCGGEDASKFREGASSSGGDAAACGAFGCAATNPDGGALGCTGLACKQATNCPPAGKTTLTGRLFDPAGKVPIYNAVIYVPNASPLPLTTGLGPSCDRCDGSISGNPIAITSTDANGDFRLENVPAGTEFPLVMQIGKWRRTVPIPQIAACQSAAADPAITRLPRNRKEGDIPRIALTTGSADPLECLLHKIGLDDSEFGAAGSDARIHLFAGGSTAPDTATSSFASGGAFGNATTLWSDGALLRAYDIVMLACEGGELAATKPVAARQALYDYANSGGRVFTSHYHHYWFSSSPVAAVRGLATWTNDYTCSGPACTTVPEPAPDVVVDATVNTSFPKGAAMKQWLRNTASLTGPSETLPIKEARHNVDAVATGAVSWMTIQNPAAGNRTAHEYVTFNAPVGATDAAVCGRVVYSDLHVGAGDATGKPFPSGCTTTELTPQQKALEFMLFDLSSCIQRDDQPPSPPK